MNVNLKLWIQPAKPLLNFHKIPTMYLLLILSISIGGPISKATTVPPLAATASTKGVSPVFAPISTMLQPELFRFVIAAFLYIASLFGETKCLFYLVQ